VPETFSITSADVIKITCLEEDIVNDDYIGEVVIKVS